MYVCMYVCIKFTKICQLVQKLLGGGEAYTNIHTETHTDIILPYSNVIIISISLL
jgi:hypothetical protein